MHKCQKILVQNKSILIHFKCSSSLKMACVMPFTYIYYIFQYSYLQYSHLKCKQYIKQVYVYATLWICTQIQTISLFIHRSVDFFSRVKIRLYIPLLIATLKIKIYFAKLRWEIGNTSYLWNTDKIAGMQLPFVII